MRQVLRCTRLLPQPPVKSSPVQSRAGIASFPQSSTNIRYRSTVIITIPSYLTSLSQLGQHLPSRLSHRVSIPDRLPSKRDALCGFGDLDPRRLTPLPRFHFHPNTLRYLSIAGHPVTVQFITRQAQYSTDIPPAAAACVASISRNQTPFTKTQPTQRNFATTCWNIFLASSFFASHLDIFADRLR